MKNNRIKKILTDFKTKETLKDKINYLFGLNNDEIGWVYPYLKDTINNLKKRVFMKTMNPEARFKVNWIDIRLANNNNNIAHATFLLENTLSMYCTTKSDSEMVIKELLNLASTSLNINNLIYYNTLYKNNISPEKKYLLDQSLIYSKFGQYQRAIEFRYDELKEIVKKDTFYRFHLHNDIGFFHTKLKNYDSALFHLKLAEQIANDYLKIHPNNPTFIFLRNLAGGNMASLMYDFGNYKEAIPLLINDFYHSVKAEEWQSAFNAASLISLCYQHIGKQKLSDKFYDTSLRLLQTKLRYHYIVRKSFYKTASNLFGLRNDYKKAYTFLKNYFQLEDSINEKQKGNANMYEALMYEIKVKNKELSTQNEILRLSKESEIKSRNIRSYGIFVFVLLIVMIFYMFQINIKLRKREQELEFKNLKIQTQNNTIQNSLKEKDLLIKEVHHRVKNNLQLIISIINLQKSKGVNPETKNILDDLKHRIFSISNAHQMLYQKNSIQSVNIKEYLNSIIKNLESTSENPINLNIQFEHTDETHFSLDNAIVIGLLISEMFTNSVKYAIKENKNLEINIKFIKDPYRPLFKLIFSDNGPGLPDTFENILKKNQSTGLELIYMLVQNISGKISVSHDPGLKYEIEFEITPKAQQVEEEVIN